MCILQVYVQCHDKFFEVSADEAENAELIVEDVVSRVLLDLFNGGTVDNVAIRFSPTLSMGLQHCSIQICAGCSCKYFTRLPCTKVTMELAVEASMSSLLRELFGSVSVESVALQPAPKAEEDQSARYACSDRCTCMDKKLA
jgi:hypothetical protein